MNGTAAILERSRFTWLPRNPEIRTASLFDLSIQPSTQSQIEKAARFVGSGIGMLSFDLVPSILPLAIGKDVVGVFESAAVIVHPVSDSSPKQLLVDDLLRQIRWFDQVSDGWDGQDSVRAKQGVVQDALVVVQNWLPLMPLPEPSLCHDGNVTLELYEENGLTRGGIELIGDHVAVFTIVRQFSAIASGRFDTKSPKEILQKMTEMRKALA